MSNGAAPVCPVSRSQPTQAVPQPNAPGVNHIPPAHNLRTVITAINTMNNVIQNITRGAPQINNVHPAGAAGIPAPKPPPPPQYARLTWREINRGYTERKVVNPDDQTQFVKIRTLAFVAWQEDAIGSRLVYKGPS